MKQRSFYHLFIMIFGIFLSPYSYSQMNQNNLNIESSTYLLQHAENPINWQRWNKKLYYSKNTDEKRKAGDLVHLSELVDCQMAL